MNTIPFNSVDANVQATIKRNFQLPIDTTNVLVDQFNRPFIKNNGRNVLPLRTDNLICNGFHTPKRNNL